MNISWLFATLILSNVHSSALYSVITVPQYSEVIETIEQLISAANASTHRIVSKDDGSIDSAVNRAKPVTGVFYAIQRHIRRNRVKLYHDVREIVPIVESNRQNILLSYEIKLLANRALFASKPLHIGQESISQLYLCWAFNKRKGSMFLVKVFNER